MAATSRPAESPPRSTRGPVEQAPSATTRAAMIATAFLIGGFVPGKPGGRNFTLNALSFGHGQAATVDEANRLVPGRMVRRDRRRRRAPDDVLRSRDDRLACRVG